MRDEYDLSNAVRGPVVTLPPGTSWLTIRLDDEVIDWFKAKVHALSGGNYQRLMNAALREHIAREGESLEDMFRRILREELRNRVSTGRALLRVIGGKKRRSKPVAAAHGAA